MNCTRYRIEDYDHKHAAAVSRRSRNERSLLVSPMKTTMRLGLAVAVSAAALCYWAPGPFSGLGEFPAEQPNDLPLSPTAQAFYRSGPTLWQRYTSFWLTSLLNRIAFFVIPVVVALIPVIGFALSIYRSLNIRRLIRSERSTPGE